MRTLHVGLRVVDPDGNRIELVQWPTGRADGLSAADWAVDQSESR